MVNLKKSIIMNICKGELNKESIRNDKELKMAIKCLKKIEKKNNIIKIIDLNRFFYDNEYYIDIQWLKKYYYLLPEFKFCNFYNVNKSKLVKTFDIFYNITKLTFIVNIPFDFFYLNVRNQLEKYYYTSINENCKTHKLKKMINMRIFYLHHKREEIENDLINNYKNNNRLIFFYLKNYYYYVSFFLKSNLVHHIYEDENFSKDKFCTIYREDYEQNFCNFFAKINNNNINLDKYELLRVIRKMSLTHNMVLSLLRYTNLTLYEINKNSTILYETFFSVYILKTSWVYYKKISNIIGPKDFSLDFLSCYKKRIQHDNFIKQISVFINKIEHELKRFISFYGSYIFDSPFNYFSYGIYYNFIILFVYYFLISYCFKQTLSCTNLTHSTICNDLILKFLNVKNLDLKSKILDLIFFIQFDTEKIESINDFAIESKFFKKPVSVNLPYYNTSYNFKEFQFNLFFKTYKYQVVNSNITNKYLFWYYYSLNNCYRNEQLAIKFFINYNKYRINSIDYRYINFVPSNENEFRILMENSIKQDYRLLFDYLDKNSILMNFKNTKDYFEKIFSKNMNFTFKYGLQNVFITPKFKSWKKFTLQIINGLKIAEQNEDFRLTYNMLLTIVLHKNRIKHKLLLFSLLKGFKNFYLFYIFFYRRIMYQE